MSRQSLLMVERYFLEQLSKGGRSAQDLAQYLSLPVKQAENVLMQLIQREFVAFDGRQYVLAHQLKNNPLWQNAQKEDWINFELEEIFEAFVAQKRKQRRVSSGLRLKKVYLNETDVFHLRQLLQKVDDFLQDKEKYVPQKHDQTHAQYAVMIADALVADLVAESIELRQ